MKLIDFLTLLNPADSLLHLSACRTRLCIIHKEISRRITPENNFGILFISQANNSSIIILCNKSLICCTSGICIGTSL